MRTSVEGTPTGTITVGTFTDLNPAATLADFTGSINWGDGGAPTAAQIITSGGGFAVLGSYKYLEEGNDPVPVTVTVTITDKGGSTTNIASHATVFDAALTSSGTTVSGTEGVALTNVMVANFHDADPGEGPGEAPADYTTTIDWGDGQTSAGTVVTDGSGGFNVNGTHTYTEGNQPGYPYPVVVTIVDASATTVARGTANIAEVDVATPKVSQTCPPGLIATASAPTSGGAGAASNSSVGVNYADGTVHVNASTGFGSDGFGLPWSQLLAWTNSEGIVGQGAEGSGMVDGTLPSIQQSGSGGGLMLTATAGNALWFDPGTGGSFNPKFFYQDKLSADSGSGDYVLTDTSGNVLRFSGFASGNPNSRGQLKSFTDPYGNVTSVTAQDLSGHVGELQRSVTLAGTTTTESWIYTYGTAPGFTDLVQNLTLRRKIGSGGWTTVRQAVYDYYDGTTSGGNSRDLRTLKIEDASGNVLDTSYFRYYVSGEANGYTRGLKYMVSPQSYARLAAAVSNPLTATDAQIAPYADAYYQYDSSQRVIKASIQGAGCSCTGSSGLGTFTYSYASSGNADGFNSWKTKTVETLPDGNTNTVYTNYAGEVMLLAYKDISDPANSSLSGKTWMTWAKYDTSGRLIEDAAPSAVTGYDDTKADLLNFQSGTSTYLANSAGILDFYDYGTSTTATASAAGDITGYLKDAKIQNGQTGTALLLSATQYFVHADANGGSGRFRCRRYRVSQHQRHGYQDNQLCLYVVHRYEPCPESNDVRDGRFRRSEWPGHSRCDDRRF